MATRTNDNKRAPFLPEAASRFLKRRLVELGGVSLAILAGLIALALASYSNGDPSLNTATNENIDNLVGPPGSYVADLLLQGFGLGATITVLVLIAWAWALISHRKLTLIWIRIAILPITLILFSVGLAAAGGSVSWPITAGMGGVGGSVIVMQLKALLGDDTITRIGISGISFFFAGIGFVFSIGLNKSEWSTIFTFTWRIIKSVVTLNLYSTNWIFKRKQDEINNKTKLNLDSQTIKDKNSSVDISSQQRSVIRNIFDFIFWKPNKYRSENEIRNEPKLSKAELRKKNERYIYENKTKAGLSSHGMVSKKITSPKPGKRSVREGQGSLNLADGLKYELPPLALLASPKQARARKELSEDSLKQNAKLLLSVLEDFGIYGEILRVHPGPVVTLYEFIPQAGTRTSRVIGLADDIARSMSAISVRVATIPGRNVIGIELPNTEREGVLLRELLGSEAYENTAAKLTLALGKTISGEPVIADLTRMPHLLVAGTTGSGKSVAVNSMILSLLYRLPPEQCRLILIDPKMLELSVYDDIPHLLTPVVTDPRKAVVALKWVVREMENRYQDMSKLGVRNITGYNKRLEEARDKGEVLTRRVQIDLDSNTGDPLFEEQQLDLSPMPYIVVVVDEMADLMLVAGKDIEGAVQRLAQMARAAGIHLIMATQRPSVDVITGTIKANFPTRISFQVTSKIDSRTILGEAGAEQLLGQGDMLFLEGGGRLTRVHGPLVTDSEVERVIDVLRSQGIPNYKSEVIEDEEQHDTLNSNVGSNDPLYDKAVELVARERKASTSFVQRHLQIGYNRAARIVEQMESEGVISKANHVGKREVLVSDHS